VADTVIPRELTDEVRRVLVSNLAAALAQAWRRDHREVDRVSPRPENPEALSTPAIVNLWRRA
jgi:hypothetical protein